MQGHSSRKQLKRGPPEHEELLQEMFGGIPVDGSSKCVPVEAFERTEEEGLAAEEQQGDDTDTYVSPHTSASVSKRSLLNHGTASSTTSPLKKSKSQMVKVMQKIHATLENMMMSKVSPMLHEHARMYPKQGLGRLFQLLMV
jgi:hypothetical protein